RSGDGRVLEAGRAASRSRMPVSSRPPPRPLDRARRPRRRLTRFFSGAVAQFLHVEAASGFVLLAAAALALVLANSPWAAGYERVLRLPVELAVDGAVFERPLRFWVNEGLMTIFFLLVGLEIRRELYEGALASRRLAALPILAAIGGMIAPALVFLAIDHGPLLRSGWAVPTATDIAFAVGVLALLGPRVPRGVRALLLALAIIDDIGAILIIALFYSRGIALEGLAAAAAGTAVALGLTCFGFSRRGAAAAATAAFLYTAAGVAIWIGLLRGGVHPTLAGVIVGLLIPVTRAAPNRPSASLRLSQALHPWVAYGIMPAFALANAGIGFRGISLVAGPQAMLSLGIGCALVIGKPLGIVLTALGALRLRLCALPRGVTTRGILTVGCLGGIGFTMSIFIAGLAFTDAALLAAAKLGILAGSACAAVVGISIGRALLGKPPPKVRH
ncbi:MAG: Na+/H+ antiporter NhaA, partial [Steroidobacteraceae bacterium]